MAHRALLLALVLVLRAACALAPPAGSPVVLGGGGPVAAAVYGKLQRAEAVFGSGLARPTLVAADAEVSMIDKVLWRRYCMSSVTAYDVLDAATFSAREPTFPGGVAWESDGVPLYFLDATGVVDDPKGGGPAFPFGLFGSGDDGAAPAPLVGAPSAPDAALLRTLELAADGHLYLLTGAAGVAACEAALLAVPGLRASLIAPVADLVSDPNWTSQRPQDLEGELVAPVSVSLRAVADDEAGPSAVAVHAQDLAEVAVQLALRLPRDVSRSVRVAGGGTFATRPNQNYFTETGGKGEGAVESADWAATFAGLGEEVRDIGRRE